MTPEAVNNLVRLRSIRRELILLECDPERQYGVSTHERTSLVDLVDRGIERCQEIIRGE